MGLAVNIILLGISGIAFAVSGGYATNAAVRVTGVEGYGDNKKLLSAHKYLSIAAVITWISIALLVVAAIILLFFSPEAGAAEAGAEAGAEAVGEVASTVAEGSGFSFVNLLIYAIMFFILGGVIAVGILSAMAANDINQSGVSDNNLSYRQSIIAACIAIPVFVLVLTVLIIKLTYKPKKKQSESSWLAQEFGGAV